MERATGYPQRLLALLDGSAGPAADRPVFERGPRVVTADELLDLVARLAAGLRQAGIGPGDGVAVALGVTPEAFAATIAVPVVGARLSGVRPGLPPAQLAALLAADVTAVLVDAAGATQALRAAAAGLPLLGVGPVPGLADLTMTPPDGGPLECTARPDDVARIVWTSGSTGLPKGCAQTYRAMAASWTIDPAAWSPGVQELAAGLGRYLVFGSLASYVMAEYGALTLAAGGVLVAADPPAFPGMIPALRATASVMTVPRLHQLVATQRTAPVDLSSLRALVVSGSRLDPGRLAEALDVLGPVVHHGYGQTEAGLISLAGPAEMMACSAVLDSVGRPVPGAEVEVAADGELVVRTPWQAAGYWGDPAGTAEVFVDGRVRTRDLGHLDADGLLHLTGRARDVVIVGAELVHPGPIERVLGTHPDVVEAYVVGAPSEETGEAVHAFVVLRDGAAPDGVTRDGAAPDLAVLRTLVAGELGAAAAPATVTAIGEVPVAPSGKPDRGALAALLGAGLPTA